MSPMIGVILGLLIVLQIVAAVFGLRMWKFIRVLVDVHASVACDLKVGMFLVFATALKIEQDNDKCESEHDDWETLLSHIVHATTDMCANAGIDGRKYVLSDMARVMMRQMKARSVYHADGPRAKPQ